MLAMATNKKKEKGEKEDLEAIPYLFIFIHIAGYLSKSHEIFRFCGSHNWKIAHKLHKQRGRKLLSLFFVAPAKRCSRGG